MRIKGNSLRLRLTQAEVKRLGAGEVVEEQTNFANAMKLSYRLEQAEQTEVQSIFEDNTIRIIVPSTAVKIWANSQQVKLNEGALSHSQNGLQITVEKDFQCLIVRAGSEDEDTFPNPHATK